MATLVVIFAVPAFAETNPYLACPDCNDTNNVQQIPPNPQPTHTTAPSPIPTQATTLPTTPSTQPTPPTPIPTPPPSPVNSTTIPTTPEKIPNWVKAIFGYYAQGNLSDDDLVKALQFLIQQGIIKVSP